MFSRITERLEVDMSMGAGSGYRRIDDHDDGFHYEPTSSNQSSSFFNLSSFTDTNDEEDDECLSRFCPSLTWQERLGGCVGCMLLGYVLSLGSLFRMRDVFMFGRGYKSFVLYSTLGNIISLSGSFFLSGPRAQINKMFHDKRKIATIMYLSSLGVTLLVCVLLPSRHNADGEDSDSSSYSGGLGTKLEGILLLLLLGCQYVSVAWYCLSYIPFARQIASRMMGNVLPMRWTQFDELD